MAHIPRARLGTLKVANFGVRLQMQALLPSVSHFNMVKPARDRKIINHRAQGRSQIQLGGLGTAERECDKGTHVLKEGGGRGDFYE